MYNRQLETFMTVAKTGSFANASKQLFITSSALVQQINSLEKNLNAKLFERSNKGLVLTEAGRYLYEEVPYIIGWDKEVREQIQRMDRKNTNVLKASVAKMHRSVCLYELWTKYSNLHPEMSLELVEAAGTDPEEVGKVYSSMDLMEFPNFSQKWFSKMEFLKLGEVEMSIAVPKSNPLYETGIIHMEQLKGQTVLYNTNGMDAVMEEGFKRMRDAGVQIVMVDEYSRKFIANCLLKKQMFVLPSCSKQIDPAFRVIRCDWGIQVPYGFFYSKAADNGPDSFIAFVRKQLKEGLFVKPED